MKILTHTNKKLVLLFCLLYLIVFLVIPNSDLRHKFWAVPTIFTLILNNSTIEFLTVYSFTVLSLVATLFRNLIYRVLNLGIMSILVAALWAYSTDLIFIYVAYILAFVGAVIMLFLSVILMLPSSVVSSMARFSFLLIQSSGGHAVYQFSLLQLFFILLLTGLAIELATALFSFFVKKQNFIIKTPPNRTIHFTVAKDTNIRKFYKNWNLAEYIEASDFYVYDSANSNNNALKDQLYGFYVDEPIVLSKKDELSFEGFTKIIVLSVPKNRYTEHGPVRKLLINIFYEFKNYYTAITKPSVNLQKNLITLAGKKPPLLITELSTRRNIIVVQFVPWWSPFNISELFSTIFGKRWYFLRVRLFSSLYWWINFFEYDSTKKMHEIFFAHLTKLVKALINNIYNLLSFCINIFKKFLLRAGCSTDEFKLYNKDIILWGQLWSLYRHKISFKNFYNVCLEAVKNNKKDSFRANVFFYDFLNVLVKTIAQSILTVSVFFLAVPLSVNRVDFLPLANFTHEFTKAESLAAVQNILYTSNPTLLFVCVISLLVALIGAAVMFKNKK